MAKLLSTPFIRQCFVVVGASVNMSQIGMVIGYAAVLLPQLKAKQSSIQINESTESWIAAAPGFALLLGNLTVPTLMAKLGRRWASLISIAIVIAGWVCVVAAQNITILLLARVLQGLSVGMSSCLTPIVIGEYTSPKNRGAFSILMSLIMAAGTLTVHTIGSYFSWKLTAVVITIITVVDMFVVVLCPETPIWLANKGKYEKSEEAFRWLRGDGEMEEMQKIIQASIAVRQNVVKKTAYERYMSILKKKEFYKPILIMMHLNIIQQWGGINILAPYIVHLIYSTCGTDLDTALAVVSIDIQRVFSCVLAVFIIRTLKRRTMLFSLCTLNALVFIVSAGYIYAKDNNYIANNPWIGIILLHVLMMTVAIGSLPLPFTIAGEIFALRYKSVSIGFSSLFSSIHIFVSVKTFPYLSNTIGLPGSYCLYAGIMIYSLFVVWFLLPETKDRTLQEIEEEFRGKVVVEDKTAAEPLKKINYS